MTSSIVIWGAGGHALVVADVARQAGFQVHGFLDDTHARPDGTPLGGAQILGGREQLPSLRNQIKACVIAIGHCQARLELAGVAAAAGFQLATLVHPRAVVASDVRVGAGTVVCAGAVINPAAVIGENVIVNTSASVDHECVLEDGVHVSPGARLAGNVRVGRGAWIGLGAVVKEKVRVGAGVVIGAGAVVLRDVPDGVVAYGVPARVIRKV
jgi:UDP-N-acetylbacillosamine N-acetyltransferase